MQSFLSRVILFVFLLNCVLPYEVWADAPSSLRRTAGRGEGRPSEIFERAPRNTPAKPRSSTVAKYGAYSPHMSHQYPIFNAGDAPMDFMQGAALLRDSLHLQHARRLMLGASTPEEYQTALVWRHNASNSLGRRRSHREYQQNWEKTLAVLDGLDQRAADAIERARGYSDHFLNVELQNIERMRNAVLANRAVWSAQTDEGEKNAVLHRWAKGDLTEGDLVEYIDPMAPESFGNLYDTLYAAEILSNTLDGFRINGLPVGKKGESLCKTWLMRTQQRVLYRYQTFASSNLNIPGQTRVQVEGTLRLLLLKIHALYEQLGWEDPLKKPYNPANFSAENRRICSGGTVQKQVKQQIKRHFGTDGIFLEFPKPLPDPEPGVSAPEPMGWSISLYEDFLQEYIRELREYKKQMDEDRGFFEPLIGDGFFASVEALGKMAVTDTDQKNKERLARMAEAQLTAQYAGTYAVLYGKGMDDLVQIFEEGSSWVENTSLDKEKFERHFASFQNVLLTALYETAQYSLHNSWDKVYNLFKRYADPANKYSFPLQVFSLEMLGLMAADGMYNNTLPEAEQQNRLTVFNSRPLPEADRALFAQWVVDLYAPLTYSKRYEDHGLNAEKLQALSNELVRIHARLTGNGHFAGGEFMPSAEYSQGYISMPGQNPGVGLKTQSSYGYYVYLNANTPVNQGKRVDDALSSVVTSAVDLALWIYGGKGVFKLVTAAGRYTKGALVAAPKAVKMFSAAGSGRKLRSAAAVFDRQFKFQSEASALVSGQNAAVIGRVTPQGVEPVRKVSRLTPPLSRSRALSTSVSGEEKALTYHFQQARPGFARVDGFSQYAGRVNAGNWTRFKNSFRDVNGARTGWKELSAAERRAVAWEQRGVLAVDEMKKEGLFDLYVPDGVLSNSNTAVFSSVSGAPQALAFARAELPGAAFIGPKDMFGVLDNKVPYQKWAAELGFEPLFLNSNTLPSALYPVKTMPEFQALLLDDWSLNYARHLSRNGALDILGGRLIGKSPLWRGLRSNAAWLGGFMAADGIAYHNPVFNYKDWAQTKTEQDYAQAMREEGVTPDSSALAPAGAATSAAPEDAAFYALHPALNDKISASGNEDSAGAAITSVIQTYKYLAGSQGSFVSEFDRFQLKQAKHNLALSDALEANNGVRQEQSKQQKRKTLENVDRSLSVIKNAKKQLLRIYPDEAARDMINGELGGSASLRNLRVLREKINKAEGKEYVALVETYNAVIAGWDSRYESLIKKLEANIASYPKAKKRAYWYREMSRLEHYTQGQPYGPKVAQLGREWMRFVDKQLAGSDIPAEDIDSFLKLNWEMQYVEKLPEIRQARLLADYTVEAERMAWDFNHMPGIQELVRGFKADAARLLREKGPDAEGEIKVLFEEFRRTVEQAEIYSEVPVTPPAAD